MAVHSNPPQKGPLPPQVFTTSSMLLFSAIFYSVNLADPFTTHSQIFQLRIFEIYASGSTADPPTKCYS